MAPSKYRSKITIVDGIKFRSKKEAKQDLSRGLTDKWSPATWLPLSEFGSVECIEFDGDGREIKHLLDSFAIRRGLQVFVEQYPHHFADMLLENGDMITGDVFVQCCLFGEVKYE